MGLSWSVQHRNYQSLGTEATFPKMKPVTGRRSPKEDMMDPVDIISSTESINSAYLLTSHKPVNFFFS